MNKTKLIFFCLLFFVFLRAEAGAFGPSNFTECVRSFSTSNSQIDIGQINRMCHSDFPVLEKLSKHKVDNLTCIGDTKLGTNDNLQVTVNLSNVKLSSQNNSNKQVDLEFSISNWSKKDLIFYRASNGGNKSPAYTGRLYIEHGSLDIVEVTDGKKEGVWFYSCSENN